MLVALPVLVLALAAAPTRCAVRIELSRIGEELEFAKQSGPDGSVTLINQRSLYYYAAADIGTPGQSMRVNFNAGYRDTWVPGRAAIAAESTHYSYDPSRSSTYRRLNRIFSNNLMEGVWARDVVSIGTLRIDDLEFGVVKNFSGWENYESRPFDGSIGLGLQWDGGVPTVLRELVKSEQISAPVFAFYIGDTGELSLGGPDPDRYEGSFHIVGLDDRAQWSIAVDGVRFGRRKKWMSSPKAIVEPWYGFVVGPQETTMQFLDEWIALGATKEYGVWWPPCDAEGPALHFRIDGQKYTLESKDLIRRWSGSMCFLAILPSTGRDEWQLGLPFLRKYYTQFDAGEKRLGFALAKHPGDNFV